MDFKAAYDSVHRAKLYEAMREFKILNDLVDLQLVQLTMKKVQCRLLVGGDLSGIFKTNNGLRQGDALSYILFNIVFERVIRQTHLPTTGSIFTTQIFAYANDRSN